MLSCGAMRGQTLITWLGVLLFVVVASHLATPTHGMKLGAPLDCRIFPFHPGCRGNFGKRSELFRKFAFAPKCRGTTSKRARIDNVEPTAQTTWDEDGSRGSSEEVGSVEQANKPSIKTKRSFGDSHYHKAVRQQGSENQEAKDLVQWLMKSIQHPREVFMKRPDGLPDSFSSFMKRSDNGLPGSFSSFYKRNEVPLASFSSFLKRNDGSDLPASFSGFTKRNLPNSFSSFYKRDYTSFDRLVRRARPSGKDPTPIPSFSGFYKRSSKGDDDTDLPSFSGFYKRGEGDLGSFSGFYGRRKRGGDYLSGFSSFYYPEKKFDADVKPYRPNNPVKTFMPFI